MDIELEKKINDAVEYLKEISNDQLDFRLMDPIAKMMLVSLLHESQKINDYIDGVGEKLIDKYCEHFIPRREVEAMPALTIIEAKFRSNKETITIGKTASFTYKLNDNKSKIGYIPIFNTYCVPYQHLYLFTHKKCFTGDKDFDISMDKEESNCIWLGINTECEIDSLKDFSIFIDGIDGVLPQHIYVGKDGYELDFSDMSKMEDLNFAEPFDSQQSSSQFFSIIENWKEYLLNMPNRSFLYITDEVKDRDKFKTCAYPEVFKKSVEESKTKTFEENTNTIWLKLEYPEDYIIPDTFSIKSIKINALPVTNVDVNSVTLTQISPIAKLQKQEDSFFLQIIETSNASNKQGFNMLDDDVIVRDFDASCYHEGNLYRDVRNIYNHFIDDYYAFIEYNGIKDGETIKQLRDLINRIGKSVGSYNSKFSFDSGTFVMKNIKQYPHSSSVKVSFATTLGKLGNKPKLGQTMENKKLPSIGKELPILVPCMGGADKANVDERYENLRYYTLTNDRLYTKKDIEAFLRKEIITEFGKKEFKRIFIDLKIEGAAGETKLQRGLYITIKFKDKKNFEEAKNSSLKDRLYQKIINRSCISMPIIITLNNIDY